MRIELKWHSLRAREDIYANIGFDVKLHKQEWRMIVSLPPTLSVCFDPLFAVIAIEPRWGFCQVGDKAHPGL